MTTKEQMLQAIRALPDDATVEGAMECLYVLSKVERGIAQADTGQKVSQEEARLRMARWWMYVTWTDQALADLEAICRSMAHDALRYMEVCVMLQMPTLEKMPGTERGGFGDELPGQNCYRTWQARWKALHPWDAHHGLRCAGISRLWHVRARHS